jgi:hypothetical protein
MAETVNLLNPNGTKKPDSPGTAPSGNWKNYLSWRENRLILNYGGQT